MGSGGTKIQLPVDPKIANSVLPPPTHDKSAVEDRKKLCDQMVNSLLAKRVDFKPKTKTGELTPNDREMIANVATALKYFSEMGLKIEGYTGGNKKLDKDVSTRLETVKAELLTLGVDNQPLELLLIKDLGGKRVRAGPGCVTFSSQPSGQNVTPEARLAKVCERAKSAFEDDAFVGKSAVFDVFCVLRDSPRGCWINVKGPAIEGCQERGDLMMRALEALGAKNYLETRPEVVASTTTDTAATYSITFQLEDEDVMKPVAVPETPVETPTMEEITVEPKPFCSFFCYNKDSSPGAGAALTAPEPASSP